MNKKRGYALALVLGYGLAVFLMRRWTSSYPPEILRQQLSFIWPYFLEGLLLAALLSLVLAREAVRSLAASVPGPILKILGVILVLAFLLSCFLPPRQHRIFYDEDIYLNIAQTMTYERKASYCLDGETRYGWYRCNGFEYNKQAYGYPYLVSVLFRLGGVSELGAHLLQNGLFALSVATVFLLGFILFRDPTAALCAAMVYLIIPDNLKWFNTTAAEPAAALFAGLALLLNLWYAKTENLRVGFTAVFVTAFAAYFRPESPLVVPLSLLSFLLIRPALVKKLEFYSLGLLLLFLLLPEFAHHAAVKMEDWGTTGDKFAIPLFDQNFPTNFYYYWNNTHFPLAISLLGLAGFSFYRAPADTGGGERTEGSFPPPEGLERSRFLTREKSIPVIWFFLFWGIFLFFYAGSYRFGADVRYAVVSFMPLSLLAGLGARLVIDRLRIWAGDSTGPVLFGVLAAFLWFSFLPYVRSADEEAWSSRVDHDAAERFSRRLLPDDVVLSNVPHMFLVMGINAVNLGTGIGDSQLSNLRNRYNRIFLYYDFWCNADENSKKICDRTLREFPHSVFDQVNSRDFSFTLFRLELPPPPPDVPEKN